jgi:hypothetical protein
MRRKPMDEIPVSIKIDDQCRLMVSLSAEQMEDLAQQVAKILMEKNNG